MFERKKVGGLGAMPQPEAENGAAATLYAEHVEGNVFAWRFGNNMSPDQIEAANR